MRPSPSPVVVAWVRNRADELYSTSITLAEIGHGIERLDEGRRKVQLKVAAEEMFAAFSSHVLALDSLAARE